MKSLSETWFADGYIDFEQKKYTLLAYLQEISKYFNENKLYPQLADVVFHYNNLVAFKENKKLLQQQFPKTLTAINLERLQLLYEQMIADDAVMTEMEDIIHFAIKKMDNTIKSGTGIYQLVEEQLNISPVGLVPLDMQEGYMLLCDGRYSDTLVYYYRLTIFERHDEKYRGIHTQYLDAYTKSFVNTCENIKTELIRSRRQHLPNPAVYKVETDLVFPVTETLLPIAKRSLVKYLTINAA
jgi:transposase-like protein